MNLSKKSQILIVDDYPTNIKVLSDLLIEYGFEVLIARDGENALQKLQRISPDMILLDVLMPGIDGFETCSRIKAQESTRDIPIIFMTALADPVDKIKGLTLGAVDYITKPFQQEEVLARVNTHLKMRYLTKQLEEQNSRLQEEGRSRQIAESALRFSEEKFAKAFRSNPGPMMILTLEEGRFIDINQNFCKILGYAPVMVLGKTLGELSLFVDAADSDRLLQSLREQQAIHNQEYAFQSRDGEVHYLLVSAEVIYLRDVPCILAMTLDITACKQAAVAMQQAKAAAELANQAKSQFLANISHEFRSPLNTILGYTQLMSRDPLLKTEQLEYLNIINRSSEHLLTLINDVLEMTKIESGRLTLNETAFNLDTLVESIVAMMEPRVQVKELQLRVERDSHVPQFVQADERKLQQILINLVGNAVKFTTRGRVTLRIAPSTTPPDDALVIGSSLTLQFEVEDTGPGIAPHEIDLLFDPFIQTDAGRRLQEGTGLGLSISKRFVQLMGGDITVQSAVGTGSIFRFTIPVTLAEVVEPAIAQPQERVLSLEPGQPTYRILTVDDQATNRQLLVKLLSSVGFAVEEAVNGDEAIAQAQCYAPHLILMDLRMPILDGYEATRRIRQLTSLTPTPIILALTANAFEEERLSALAAGCDDFIRKPIQEGVLFSKIAEHLEVRYVYQTATPTPSISSKSDAYFPFTLSPGVRKDLRELTDHDEAFLADYLNAHIEQLPRLMQALQSAIAHKNAGELALAAHTLKGVGMTFGVEQFTALCQAIEQMAQAGNTTITQEQLQQLETELTGLLAAIQHESRNLAV
ncbi:response regulator [Oscillatoria sp. FACHB-1407]|uniref:response regulator n=1 Tax=Oscillatoria sp. FACHB-1407 TaxID=2692847 RepID=UPI00168246AC|nr:response regulator [Oscillatoria sp. FACHB-1407]MBD2464339.1 response regulator [Oscillatoria sp. FACHB-1407]